MKAPKHPSFGLSASLESGEHNKWNTLCLVLLA